MLECKKFTDFPRGTMYGILQDAYAYDERNKKKSGKAAVKSRMTFFTIILKSQKSMGWLPASPKKPCGGLKNMKVLKE